MNTQLTPEAEKAIGMMKHVVKIGLVALIFGGFWYANDQGYLKLPDVKTAVVPPTTKIEAPVLVQAIPSNEGGGASTVGALVSSTKATALIGANADGDKTDVRFLTIPWNAVMGTMLANGGTQTQPGSLMDQNGINLKIVRQDDYSAMKAEQITFATQLKNGHPQPTSGVHFVNIMGNGGPNYLRGLNIELAKLGPEYIAEIIAPLGYSRGEDRCMGTPDVMPNGIINPDKLRGMLIAAVHADGDEDLCLQVAATNGIPVNPDSTVYDRSMVNFYPVSSFVEADNAWISGLCVDLPVVENKARTGEIAKVCVNGVATWTPGDETVVTEKGGLVTLASTKEYAYQMPATLIGIKKWNSANQSVVTNMLAAIYAGGESVQGSPDNLLKAAAVSAGVYGEKDAAYWARLYQGDKVKDKQTQQFVEVGGSFTAGLGDAALVSGFLPGTTNKIVEMYNDRGNAMRTVFPDDLPDFPAANQVINLSYVKAVFDRAAAVKAPVQTVYAVGTQLTSVMADKNWNIQFKTGSAEFDAKSGEVLNALYNSTSLTTMKIAVIGHTDSTGSAATNTALSARRAEAVKNWLQAKSPANYPDDRFIVSGVGPTQPIAANATEAGRAQNRRVEIKMGN